RFLERLQAGEEPDPDELILAHPDLADRLEPELESAERLFRQVRAERSLAGAATDHPPQADVTTLPEAAPPPRHGRHTGRGGLGRGASAVVYEAHDPKFDRDVALKVLRAGPDSDAARRHRRDACIAARLRHQNIVPLHEAGEDGGLYYLDMELIRG